MTISEKLTTSDAPLTSVLRSGETRRKVRSTLIREFEAVIGPALISVVTAKKPFEPWDPKLQALAIGARFEYEKLWGAIPVKDSFDHNAYVDIAFVTYRRNGKSITEGLTMRTIQLNLETIYDNSSLPVDLQFFVGPSRIPVFDLLAQELYQGDKKEAGKRIVVASRVAPLRSTEGGHNKYTPEAFAAIQMVAANRAAQSRVEYFVNTMRPEMDDKVLTLSNNKHFSHTLTETTLNLPPNSVHLDRRNPIVMNHLFNFPGYFNRVDGLRRFLKSLDSPELLQQLVDLGIDPQAIDNLKPTQMKLLVPLLTQKSDIGEMLREGIITEVQDGCLSYTMSTQSRLLEGENLLKASLLLSENEKEIA